MSYELPNVFTEGTESFTRDGLHFVVGAAIVVTAGYLIQKTMKVITNTKRQHEHVDREGFAREYIPEPSPTFLRLDDLKIINGIMRATDLAAKRMSESAAAIEGWEKSLPLPPNNEGHTELGFEG